MEEYQIWWSSLQKDIKNKIVESLYVAYKNSLDNDEEINNMKLILEREKNREIEAERDKCAKQSNKFMSEIDDIKKVLRQKEEKEKVMMDVYDKKMEEMEILLDVEKRKRTKVEDEIKKNYDVKLSNVETLLNREREKRIEIEREIKDNYKSLMKEKEESFGVEMRSKLKEKEMEIDYLRKEKLRIETNIHNEIEKIKTDENFKYEKKILELKNEIKNGISKEKS